MNWRGYLVTSVVLGLVIGELFAHSRLVVSVPIFCILFAVVAMDEWLRERSHRRAVEKRSSRLAHNQQIPGSSPGRAIDGSTPYGSFEIGEA